MVKRCLLIVVFGVLLLASSIRAQDASAPIIALSKGDFYAINPEDGSIEQLTKHPSLSVEASPAWQRDLAISPDGQYLAYLQTPRFYALALKNNLVGNIGASPTDIVLLNISNGDEKVITKQQANITYQDQPRLWYRNHPSWSPDGRTLMFEQYRGIPDEPSFDAEVILYDLSTNTSRTLLVLETYASKSAWLGNSEIIAGRGRYDLSGRLLSQFYVNEGMSGRYLTHYQGQDYAIVDSPDVTPHDGRTYVMNLKTGAHGVVKGLRSSISAVSPENSLVFVKDDNDTRPWYVINPQTGDNFIPPKKAPFAMDYTFSPDGQKFAFIRIRTSINIIDASGHEIVVDFDADAILWSTKQYTVASENGDQSAPVEPTDDFFNVKRCGTLPSVGLVAGGHGKVIVGSGSNRIRKAPNTEAEQIGQIPDGATFTVVDGQQGVCSTGIRWAQVTYGQVTGWTAEGADGQAFLEVVPN